MDSVHQGCVLAHLRGQRAEQVSHPLLMLHVHSEKVPALRHPERLVVEPEVPVHLRSRQSFLAAMARIFPSPEKPTYEREPRSR